MARSLLHVGSAIPAGLCLACGLSLTGVKGGTVAAPGDYALCVRCGEVMQFDSEMKLGAVTAAEFPAWLLPRIEALCKRLGIAKCKRRAWGLVY